MANPAASRRTRWSGLLPLPQSPTGHHLVPQAPWFLEPEKSNGELWKSSSLTNDSGNKSLCESATLRFSDTQAVDCQTCMAGGRAPRRASSSCVAQIRRLRSSTLRSRSNACFLSLTPHASDGHAGATEGGPVLREPDLHKQHESRSSQLMNLEVTNSYCKSTREDIPLLEHPPRVDPARTNHLRPQDHWHAYMERRRQRCHNRSVFPSHFNKN